MKDANKIHKRCASRERRKRMEEQKHDERHEKAAKEEYIKKNLEIQCILFVHKCPYHSPSASVLLFFFANVVSF